jgi:hypothetical protein
MAQRYPRNWDWSKEKYKPLPLAKFVEAPPQIGFYELGYVNAKGEFEAQYAGRAMGITLRQRLGQHFGRSHNENVRKNKAKLYFRCKVCATEELAAFVEAVSLAALEYPWNRRNEWKQHWALEF